MLFNLIFFILLGSIFPWQAFAVLGVGRLVLISGSILLFRRLPFVMALRPFIPQLRTGREAFFAGWFGPMGVGAIFFAMVCRHHTELPQETSSSIFTVVSFVVFSSIVIHGITVPITHVHLKNRARKKAARRKGFIGDLIAPMSLNNGINANSGSSNIIVSANHPDNISSVNDRTGDNASAIVDIIQPMLRDIPEPRLVGNGDNIDIGQDDYDESNDHNNIERHLVYGNSVSESRMTSNLDISMLSHGGNSGRRKVADSSTIAFQSELATTTETDDLDLTTEEDSNLGTQRRPKRPPYRMRPITTTDFEEGQYDYEEAYGSESTTSAAEPGEATFDGRTLRQEQILARLMQQQQRQKNL